MNQAKIKIYVDSGSYILLDVHNHLPPYSITMSNSDSPLQANSFTVYLPEFLAQSLKEVKIFILIYPRVKNKHLLISWLSACIERPRVAPPWHCTDCCFRWRCGDTSVPRCHGRDHFYRSTIKPTPLSRTRLGHCQCQGCCSEHMPSSYSRIQKLDS